MKGRDGDEELLFNFLSHVFGTKQVKECVKTVADCCVRPVLLVTIVSKIKSGVDSMGKSLYYKPDIW